MDMVRHHADSMNDDAHLVACRPERSLQHRLNLIVDQWFPILCCPHEMIEEPPMRHDVLSPCLERLAPCSASERLRRLSPWIYPGAIIRAPHIRQLPVLPFQRPRRQPRFETALEEDVDDQG